MSAVLFSSFKNTKLSTRFYGHCRTDKGYRPILVQFNHLQASPPFTFDVFKARLAARFHDLSSSSFKSLLNHTSSASNGKFYKTFLRLHVFDSSSMLLFLNLSLIIFQIASLSLCALSPAQ